MLGDGGGGCDDGDDLDTWVMSTRCRGKDVGVESWERKLPMDDGVGGEQMKREDNRKAWI
jgi:hypothetical protein